jgi:hypothetical protein
MSNRARACNADGARGRRADADQSWRRQTIETMFLPGGLWQSLKPGEFGVTSQCEGTFERYMTGMMTAPIAGALAGNVFEQFRVELDYANQQLHLSSR